MFICIITDNGTCMHHVQMIMYVSFYYINIDLSEKKNNNSKNDSL